MSSAGVGPLCFLKTNVTSLVLPIHLALLLPSPPTDIAPPPTTRLRSLWTASLSSGSDQRRISGCGTGWLLAGPDSLPLWLCRVCAFVLLRCFSCSHTALPKELSLGVIFFSSLSSCYAVFFFNSTCISLLIILCMIVYVTNNKEPWTFWSTSCFLLLTSFLKMLISFSSRIWHLPTLPKHQKLVKWTIGVGCAWLASKLTRPEPQRESMGYCQEEN